MSWRYLGHPFGHDHRQQHPPRMTNSSCGDVDWSRNSGSNWGSNSDRTKCHKATSVWAAFSTLGSWPGLLFSICRVTGQTSWTTHRPSTAPFPPVEGGSCPSPLAPASILCSSGIRDSSPFADLYISWQHNLLIECLAGPQQPPSHQNRTATPPQLPNPWPAVALLNSSKLVAIFRLSIVIANISARSFCSSSFRPAGLILSATLCCAFRQLC